MDPAVPLFVCDLGRLVQPRHAGQRWSPANRPYAGDRPRPPGSSSNGRCGRTTATRFRRAGSPTWMPHRTATPVNRSLGTWCHCPPNHGRQDTADMPDTTPWRDRGDYYILPKDDPLAALNILREAAGLGQLDNQVADHA